MDGIQTTGADVEISWNVVRNTATAGLAGQEAGIIANPSRGPQNIHHNTVTTSLRGIEFQSNSGSIHHNTFVDCNGGYMLFVKLPVAADGYDQYLPDAEIAGKNLAIYNNTGEGGSSSPVWILRDKGTCELKNNLFIPGASTCYVLSSGATAVTTLHKSPDTLADYVATSSTTPMFTSWMSDLRLQSGSPATGKGAHSGPGSVLGRRIDYHDDVVHAHDDRHGQRNDREEPERDLVYLRFVGDAHRDACDRVDVQ